MLITTFFPFHLTEALELVRVGGFSGAKYDDAAVGVIVPLYDTVDAGLFIMSSPVLIEFLLIDGIGGGSVLTVPAIDCGAVL